MACLCSSIGNDLYSNLTNSAILPDPRATLCACSHFWLTYTASILTATHVPRKHAVSTGDLHDVLSVSSCCTISIVDALRRGPARLQSNLRTCWGAGWVLHSGSRAGLVPAQAHQCNRQTAGVDFGVRGTHIPATPVANHTTSGWDDVASSSVEDAKPPLSDAHASCPYLPTLFQPLFYLPQPSQPIGKADIWSS